MITRRAGCAGTCTSGSEGGNEKTYRRKPARRPVPDPTHPLRPRSRLPVLLAHLLRYEQNSLFVSSNKSFSGWAEIFGDAVAVAAMVDRLVHHSEIIVLKDHSYRLKGKHKEVTAAEQTH